MGVKTGTVHMTYADTQDIIRRCVKVACDKIEAAGLVPFVNWDWFDGGTVYIELFVPVKQTQHRPLGITIRISDHPPAPHRDASWSMHPGCDNDIDQLVARARRQYQLQRNSARSRAAVNRQYVERIKRRPHTRVRA